MEGKQGISDQIGDHSPEWVKRLEQTGTTVAESLSQIVNTVEEVAQSISKFFHTLKRQRDTVRDFGQVAGEKIRPVTQKGLRALSSSRDLGGRLLARGRENPTPFLIGAIAIVGGIVLLAFNLREESGVRNSDLSGNRAAS